MPEKKNVLDIPVNGTRDNKYVITGSGEQFYAVNPNISNGSLSKAGMETSHKKASQKTSRPKSKKNG